MVIKETLSKYFNKRWNAIENHLNEMCLAPDEEVLHEFRLDIKKTRSLVKLISACSNRKGISVKTIKGLYDRLGAIRSAHINIELLLTYKIGNVDVEEEQYSIIENESYLLSDEKLDYLAVIKKLKNKFEINLENIKAAGILSYYQQRLDTLAKNFLPPSDTTVLHKSRVIIKDLLFPLKIMPQSLIKEINVDKEYLKKVEEAIGKWHDTNVVAGLLSGREDTGSPGFIAIMEEKQKQVEVISKLTENFNVRVVNIQ